MHYRKQFTRSDFSKTLRELGLTPSAVSLLDTICRRNRSDLSPGSHRIMNALVVIFRVAQEMYIMILSHERFCRLAASRGAGSVTSTSTDHVELDLLTSAIAKLQPVPSHRPIRYPPLLCLSLV